MTLLLMGAGPRLAWVRSVLEVFCALADPASEIGAGIVVVEGQPTRELLVSLADRPIDALVLVDHSPFVDGAVPEAAALAEAARGEAQRAVFALELAHRAARTLSLSGGDSETWVAAGRAGHACRHAAPARLPGAALRGGRPGTDRAGTAARAGLAARVLSRR
ncbi:MAG: hypothetical protein WCI21_01170 [Alphaproteobacteria bacterium]